MPRVSILIPCFNAERWIAQAILSALNQSHPDREVIVVDDGSTDGSLDIIRSFGDSVRWESGHNRGGNAARNRLLELSSGEWLQYLDADDYLLPDKLVRQLDFLALTADADVVFSPTLFEVWDDNVQVKEPCYFPIPDPHDPWELLARWKLPQTGGPLFRRAALTAAGGWNEDRRCCQEHDLYFRLLRAGARFRYCEDAGAVYRYWSRDTVSRVNERLVQKVKMEIVTAIERYLQGIDQLTTARRHAINMNRFLTMRALWSVERAQAMEVYQLIMASDPSFKPVVSSAYRFIYRLAGPRPAEWLAAVGRLNPLRSQRRFSRQNVPVASGQNVMKGRQDG